MKSMLKNLAVGVAVVAVFTLAYGAANRIGAIRTTSIVNDGTLTQTGASSLVGALSLDDGSGASPNFTLQDETNQTLVLAKPDGAAATMTCAQGMTLVGNTGITGTLDVSSSVKAGSGDVALTNATGNIVGSAFLAGTGGTSLADPADGAIVTTTVTVTGATVGDYCDCAPSTFTGLVPDQGSYHYMVSGNDTVTIVYQDSLANAAHADPDGAGTWDCIVIPD